PTTTARSSSIPTATTSKPSAIDRREAGHRAVSVGWAKARLRRAHHLSTKPNPQGGHASLCPPLYELRTLCHRLPRKSRSALIKGASGVRDLSHGNIQDVPASRGENQMRHNHAILDFQRKRGDSSAAFVLPFLNEAMDILDVGCGPGTITAALARAARSAVGIDISAKAIAAARAMAADARLPNIGFIRGTMTAL